MDTPESWGYSVEYKAVEALYSSSMSGNESDFRKALERCAFHVQYYLSMRKPVHEVVFWRYCPACDGGGTIRPKRRRNTLIPWKQCKQCKGTGRTKDQIVIIKGHNTITGKLSEEDFREIIDLVNGRIEVPIDPASYDTPSLVDDTSIQHHIRPYDP